MRQEVIAAVLLGIGVAGFAAAWMVRSEQTASFVERPAATGDVGTVLVYAQEPTGPVRLQPGRLRTIARPQYLAFQLSATGTGPRIVRLELEGRGQRVVLHEQRLEAPADRTMIDHVLPLDETLPDELVLHVVLEAPHSTTVESTYPLRLFGSQAEERVPTSTSPLDSARSGR